MLHNCGQQRNKTLQIKFEKHIEKATENCSKIKTSQLPFVYFITSRQDRTFNSPESDENTLY